MSDYITTYTGRKFYPLNPNSNDICILDIAHHLSNITRFNGSCKQFYSVAQHSVGLARYWSNTIIGKRYALLHDAAEAYLLDIPRPVKHSGLIQEYRELEDKIKEIILDKFEVLEIENINLYDKGIANYEGSRLVKNWDEPRLDMPDPIPNEIPYWPPEIAKLKFLEMAIELEIIK